MHNKRCTQAYFFLFISIFFTLAIPINFPFVIIYFSWESWQGCNHSQQIFILQKESRNEKIECLFILIFWGEIGWISWRGTFGWETWPCSIQLCGAPRGRRLTWVSSTGSVGNQRHGRLLLYIPSRLWPCQGYWGWISKADHR